MGWIWYQETKTSEFECASPSDVVYAKHYLVKKIIIVIIIIITTTTTTTTIIIIIIIIIQDNPVSVINTGIKGSPVIRVHK